MREQLRQCEHENQSLQQEIVESEEHQRAIVEENESLKRTVKELGKRTQHERLHLMLITQEMSKTG